MEIDEPSPRPSGVRPPTDPPRDTAVGFAPEPEDDFGTSASRCIAAHLRERYKLANLGEMGLRAVEIISPEAFDRYFESETIPPTQVLVEVRQALVSKRNEISEQLDLEKAIARPPRADRLAGFGESGMISGHERLIGFIDEEIARLDRILARVSD